MKTTVALLLTLITLGQAVHLESHQLAKLPQYIGVGYNIFKGNPLTKTVDPGYRQQVFEFTYAKGETTGDEKFTVPDGIQNRQSFSCSYEATTKSYSGTSSYQNQLNVLASVEGGYNGPVLSASFSLSVGYQEMENKTTQSKSVVSQATAACQAYKLYIGSLTTKKLSLNFKELAKKAYQSNDWTEFINAYGTHFSTEITMGGRAVQQMEFSLESVARLKSVGVSVEVAASAEFAKFYGSASVSTNVTNKTATYAENFKESKSQFYIGGEAPTNGNTQEWMTKVKSNPMPVKVSLKGLYEVFPLMEDSTFNATLAKTKFEAAWPLYCSNLPGCRPATTGVEIPQTPKLATQYSFGIGGIEDGVYKVYNAPNQITMELKKVTVQHGDADIKSIQFLFSDGVTSTWSVKHGGECASYNEFSWEVPADEHVTQVQVYRDYRIVQALVFMTNKGTRSTKLGWGPANNFELYNVPAGFRISGFFTYSRCAVFQLGFISSKPYFAPDDKPFAYQERTLPVWPAIVNRGERFKYVAPSPANMELRQIRAYINNNTNGGIISIEFVFANNYSSYTTPRIGGNGGTLTEFTVPAAERISEGNLYYTNTVAALRFFCNGNSRSPYFGRASRIGTTQWDFYQYSCPSGDNCFKPTQRIVGVYGKAAKPSQGNAVDQIGFILGSRP